MLVAFRMPLLSRTCHFEPLPHRKRCKLWIASDEDRVLGFCHLESEEDHVWLENIAVDPSCQTRGFGTALAHHALSANGICPQHPAHLNVSSKNLAAISIYERLGFERHREKYRYSVPHGELVASLSRKWHVPTAKHRNPTKTREGCGEK